MLHVGGRDGCALEGVEDGPVFGAKVKCDEVACPVVPRPTACGDGGSSGVPLWGKVMGVGPPRGGLAHAEDLVYFWLIAVIEQGRGLYVGC